MKWPKDVLRLPAEGEAPSAGGDVKVPAEIEKTFNINGKEVSPEVAASALNLYNALGDPETSSVLIRTLAERAGILKEDGEIKGDKNKAADKMEGRITRILKSKLGKDYEKFSDTLGPLIDEGIQEYLEEHMSKIGDTQAAGSWADAVDNFTETHTLTDDISSKMTEIINRSGGRPNLKGKEATEYLNDMYELAVHKLGIEPPDNPKETRKGRNRRAIDDMPEFREERRPKGPMSIDDAVEAAMRGVRFK
jgi:chorismate mutase